MNTQHNLNSCFQPCEHEVLRNPGGFLYNLGNSKDSFTPRCFHQLLLKNKTNIYILEYGSIDMKNDTMEKMLARHSKKKLTRARAIRLYCKELCSNGDVKSWKECTFFDCFLWRFRLGREITSLKRNALKKQHILLVASPKNSKSKEGTS